MKKIPGSPWSEVPFTNLNMRDRASANYVFTSFYGQALFLEFSNLKVSKFLSL